MYNHNPQVIPSLPDPYAFVYQSCADHPITPLEYSKILFTISHTDIIKRSWSVFSLQGFHGAGGGGGVGNIGGTAEKMVFLSIFEVLSPERATRAATKPAFPARVGSE